MAAGKKVRLSEQSDMFCREFLRRWHSSRQVALKGVINHLIEIAITIAKTKQLSREDLRNINDGPPISEAHQIYKDCLTHVGSFMSRIGYSDHEIDDDDNRSAIISSAIVYCIRNIPDLKHTLFYRLRSDNDRVTKENPLQIWFDLDDSEFKLLFDNAKSNGTGTTLWLSNQFVSLFDRIRQMGSDEYDNFRGEVLGLARQYDRSRINPHFVEIEVGPDRLQVEDIEKVRANLDGDQRPHFDGLKNALAARAIRLPSIARN